MPRPRKAGAPEPKKRSRNGCWACKVRKIKCNQGKPVCDNCQQKGATSCDYSIRLNWNGRGPRPKDETSSSGNLMNFRSLGTTNDTDVSESSGTPASSGASHFSGNSVITDSIQVANNLGPSSVQIHYRGYESSSMTDHPEISCQDFQRASTQKNEHSSKRIRYTKSFCDTENMDSVTIIDPLTLTIPIIDKGASYNNTQLKPSPAHNGQDIRRLSVESLLSDPPRIIPGRNYSLTRATALKNYINVEEDSMTIWGFDCGFGDLDIGKNDDANAISGDGNTFQETHETASGGSPAEFGFGMRARNVVGEHGYYSSPIEIAIPRSFEPLPPTLLSNPMNILYFHFFITHTARVLIPHHCKANPLTHVLPQLAIRDSNLLNLLLAYSAFHRARLLRYPEPSNRIALWMQDIFPDLRHALDDPNQILSNTHLATAIMLASLEIISPKAFEISVPWQTHLATARQMILARGGVKTIHQKDSTFYFLSRWFIYLDVIGSLSGGKNGFPDTAWEIENTFSDEEGHYQIECVLGFTSQCVTILSKIADLTRKCEKARLQPTWQPSSEMIIQASKLKADLEAAMKHPHISSCSNLEDENSHQDRDETLATNEAFHWAGLIHLQRRILCKQSNHPDVQTPVKKIMDLLQKIRRGGPAEGCLLFPIFTAGCELSGGKDVGEGWKKEVLERMRGMESGGMAHMGRARILMEKVWDHGGGRSWVEVVEGEFFG